MSRDTDRTMDMVSYQTILCPQGSMVSTEGGTELGGILLRMETERWHYKKHFFVTTLAFCLGLSNIWMFPKHAIIHGNATYVYLYIMYSLVFGTSLLFFEVCLGQYANKGFGKIFSLCPIFEGLSFSMLFYCLLKTMFYNVLNVHTVYYLVASFHKKMPHSVYQSHGNNSSTHRDSPEFEYFNNVVLLDKDQPDSAINMKSCGLLFMVWGIIFIFLFLVVSRRLIWVPLILSSLIILVVTYTMILAVSLRGASSGIHVMFVPTENDLAEIETWIHPFEQSLITMGVGMGPLIYFGSYSKFRTSTHISCLLISFVSLAVSLLSGVTFFAIVGSLAHDQNISVQDLIKKSSENPYEDFRMHVIFSQFLNKLIRNLSQSTSAVYFLVLLLDGFFSASIYTVVLIIWLKTFITVTRRTRVYLILGVCVFCFLIGSVVIRKESPQFLAALEKTFMGPSILLITFCELLGVGYFYGLGNYCDDIEFMMGYIPNYFYQISWLISPFIILLQFGLTMSLLHKKAKNWFDYSAVMLMVVLILCPIISFSLYNCYIAVFKLRNLSAILHPKVSKVLPESESSEAQESHKNQ